MFSINTSQVKTATPPPVGRDRRLLHPLPEPGHFLFVIDNSGAERFVCPTLAQNYLCESREAKPRNAAKNFGSLLHVGIEKLLLPEPNEDPAALLQRATQTLVQHATEKPLPPDDYRTVPVAMQTLAHYQVRQSLPDYALEIMTDEKGPLVERPFELPLGVLEIEAEVDCLPKDGPKWSRGGPYLPSNYVSYIHVAWAGRIDVIARCLGHFDKRIRVIDHKTTSQGDADFIADFHLSSQSRGYVWAARQIWPEMDITGFCLDAIHLRSTAGGATNLVAPGPRGGKPPLQFFRNYFEYSQNSIDSWAQNALTRVEDFFHCVVRGEFPMETTYCFNRKYGKCDYHDVCMAQVEHGRESALQMLHSDIFQRVVWDPTAER